jgi:hypothetical protein
MSYFGNPPGKYPLRENPGEKVEGNGTRDLFIDK